MKRRPPQIVREAIVALAARGHVADVDLGNGHYKVRWFADGRSRMVVISRSPSDHRTRANARATLKRLLRDEAVSP
jgi:hypothetical protein